VKIVKGNLIDMAFNGDFDVIIHGCNCQCRMKSGIAREIAERIPEAVEADNETSVGDASKLGGFTFAHALDDFGLPVFTVINAYTQLRYGTDSRKVDYDAVRAVFRKVANRFGGGYIPFRIGYPKIGAGLAGGDWDIISKIIDEELEGLDHTLVEFDG
jgi:O-acetyl-ADP-ribose deacetylase (regulator of RNase III)